jgi:phosphatidylserine synthase
MEQIVVGLLVWIILQIQLFVSAKNYGRAKKFSLKVQKEYLAATLIGVLACSINFISIILALYIASYIANWWFCVSIVLTFVNTIFLTWIRYKLATIVE